MTCKYNLDGLCASYQDCTDKGEFDREVNYKDRTVYGACYDGDER
jgi:hypothetical protein